MNPMRDNPKILLKNAFDDYIKDPRGQNQVEASTNKYLLGRAVPWSFYLTCVVGVVATITAVATAIFSNSSLWVAALITASTYAIAAHTIYELSIEVDTAVYIKALVGKVKEVMATFNELHAIKKEVTRLLKKYDVQNDETRAILKSGGEVLDNNIKGLRTTLKDLSRIIERYEKTVAHFDQIHDDLSEFKKEKSTLREGVIDVQKLILEQKEQNIEFQNIVKKFEEQVGIIKKIPTKEIRSNLDKTLKEYLPKIAANFKDSEKAYISLKGVIDRHFDSRDLLDEAKQVTLEIKKLQTLMVNKKAGVPNG